MVCHTGLPEAIGPRPGLADIDASLPRIDPTHLTALIRDNALGA